MQRLGLGFRKTNKTECDNSVDCGWKTIALSEQPTSLFNVGYSGGDVTARTFSRLCSIVSDPNKSVQCWLSPIKKNFLKFYVRSITVGSMSNVCTRHGPWQYGHTGPFSFSHNCQQLSCRCRRFTQLQSVQYLFRCPSVKGFKQRIQQVRGSPIHEGRLRSGALFFFLFLLHRFLLVDDDPAFLFRFTFFFVVAFFCVAADAPAVRTL